MSYAAGSGYYLPPVRIVPAHHFVRHQQQQQQQQQQRHHHLYAPHHVAWDPYLNGGGGGFHQPSIASSSSAALYPIPENAAYFLGMSSGGYTHEPYGHNAYIDGSYYPGYAAYAGHAYGGTGIYGSYPATATTSAAAAAAAYPSTSSYMAYPQPSPPYRRARTAPSRTPLKPAATATVYPTMQRTRATATRERPTASREPDRPATKSPFSVAGTRRQPATHTWRTTRHDPAQRYSYQETSFMPPSSRDYGVHTIGRPYSIDVPVMGPATTTAGITVGPPPSRSGGGTPAHFYTPSYTTYPPSKMPEKKKKKAARSYPLYARITLKATQLLLGAAILGLVLGPMRATSFIDFVTRTRTEWQGAVVGVIAAFAIATAVLLATATCFHKRNGWRRIDAHTTGMGAFLYIVAAGLETYYAACYPPDGHRINLVCHRAEWIIAAVLCFMNMLLYGIDLVLSWFAGVAMW